MLLTTVKVFTYYWPLFWYLHNVTDLCSGIYMMLLTTVIVFTWCYWPCSRRLASNIMLNMADISSDLLSPTFCSTCSFFSSSFCDNSNIVCNRNNNRHTAPTACAALDGGLGGLIIVESKREQDKTRQEANTPHWHHWEHVTHPTFGNNTDGSGNTSCRSTTKEN